MFINRTSLFLIVTILIISCNQNSKQKVTYDEKTKSITINKKRFPNLKKIIFLGTSNFKKQIIEVNSSFKIEKINSYKIVHNKEHLNNWIYLDDDGAVNFFSSIESFIEPSINRNNELIIIFYFSYPFSGNQNNFLKITNKYNDGKQFSNKLFKFNENNFIKVNLGKKTKIPYLLNYEIISYLLPENKKKKIKFYYSKEIYVYKN